MLVILGLVILSLVTWTIISLVKKGDQHEEIKTLLKKLGTSLKELAIDTSRLCLLLYKDTFQSESKVAEADTQIVNSLPEIEDPSSISTNIEEACSISSHSKPNGDSSIAEINSHDINTSNEEDKAA
tara:strand:- start:505 stop:885 length:381 start_codon:yes stop_codon:yes gene_type:complete